MTEFPTAERLFDLFFLLQKRMTRAAARMDKNEFSPLQMHVLVSMLDKDAFAMTELASETLISKQQLSPIVDRLVATGLVLREPDAGDRRVVKVRLTPAGLEFLTARKQEMIAIYEETFTFLGGDDLDRLNYALNELQEILRKMPDSAIPSRPPSPRTGNNGRTTLARAPF